MKRTNLGKTGISLIVLIITIIVIIILAGAVILSLSKNNPISSANKATFLSDIEAFNNELLLYKTKQYGETLGQYDPQKLNATKTGIIYDGQAQAGDIKDIIPSLGKKTQYLNEFEVQSGGLVYVGTDTNKKQWLEETDGIEAGDATPVNVVSDPGYVASKGVNGPVLMTGMTPIKWDASGNVVTTTASDTDWYDYANKKWANAQTADGSMWVWIPRYEYKIPTPHTSTAQTIAVNFLQNTNTTATSGYTVHPAFTFGSTELTGIWVAKFEASGTTSAVESKPDAYSLTTITIDQMFTASRNMETNSRYGWETSGTGIDTHQMKNTEWGAIAYLSSSPYGKSGEVWINPYWDDSINKIKTGQAGTEVSAESTTSTYAYNNSSYGVNASTSGTVYGVYDMSGGASEYTAAYVNNGVGGTTLVVSEPDAKYKDVYTVTSDNQSIIYANASDKKGDAVYETSSNGVNTSTSSSWYSDFSDIPFSIDPFFLRGGNCSMMTNAGMFAFESFYGAFRYMGFRPVLAVHEGI